MNASPIIMLARGGYLNLLAEPDVDALVPRAVYEEVIAGPEGDPARVALLDGWKAPVEVETVPVA